MHFTTPSICFMLNDWLNHLQSLFSGYTDRLRCSETEAEVPRACRKTGGQTRSERFAQTEVLAARPRWSGRTPRPASCKHSDKPAVDVENKSVVMFMSVCRLRAPERCIMSSYNRGRERGPWPLLFSHKCIHARAR